MRPFLERSLQKDVSDKLSRQKTVFVLFHVQMWVSLKGLILSELMLQRPSSDSAYYHPIYRCLRKGHNFLCFCCYYAKQCSVFQTISETLTSCNPVKKCLWFAHLSCYEERLLHRSVMRWRFIIFCSGGCGAKLDTLVFF